MIFLTSPGKTYSVNSISGCTISSGGTTLATIPANVQTTFIATEDAVIVSDNNAIIVEVTGVGAGGSGSTGGSGGSGGPVDLTGVALLEGGNAFTGDQTIEGDVTINGTLTVSGDVTTEGEYIGAEVIETSDTTITPEAGKYYKYTGTEDTLTVSAPDWNGYATISYLETAAPVDLQGVTWSPAKPSLTGAGPFVYTLACSEPGSVLASAMNYSVATAEAVQAVVPIAWEANKTTTNYGTSGFVIGQNSRVGHHSVALGDGCSTANNSVVVGKGSQATGTNNQVILGWGCQGTGTNSVLIGHNGGNGTIKSNASTSITIGAAFFETVDGANVPRTCTTFGTGSITIGAGANTLNSTTTVDGVETTVESSNSITIGCKASNTGADSVVIGAQARNVSSASVAIGTEAAAASIKGTSIGAKATSSFNCFAAGYESLTNGVNSVAIGGGAKSYSSNTVLVGSAATITNTGSTLSENTTVIGYGATASAPNAVVLGAGCSTTGNRSVVIGANQNVSYASTVCIGYNVTTKNISGVAIGHDCTVDFGSVAIGKHTSAGTLSVALGINAKSTANRATAIGASAAANDGGVVVFSSWDDAESTKTQLYFSGANTSLANQYYGDENGENGEAFMGYTVTDANNNVLACGTRRLSDLFTDNTLNQAATIDEETGEYVMPKVFHPSDLDLPVEEPEDITINIPEPVIPEPELYTPLPVYPIVEPEVPSEV